MHCDQFCKCGHQLCSHDVHANNGVGGCMECDCHEYHYKPICKGGIVSRERMPGVFDDSVIPIDTLEKLFGKDYEEKLRNSRVVICGTPAGENYFYDLWKRGKYRELSEKLCIRKVKVLHPQLKKAALDSGMEENDLVIVRDGCKIEKIEGNPIEYLQEHSDKPRIDVEIEKEDGIWCPRCGEVFHDEDMEEKPEDYWSCPTCKTVEHTKCRGPLDENTVELGPNTKTIKIELYYERGGKDFIDSYYEAPEKLEQRDVAFLLGCFLKFFIKYGDEEEDLNSDDFHYGMEKVDVWRERVKKEGGKNANDKT